MCPQATMATILCRKRGMSEAFGSPSHQKMARVGAASCSPHKIAFLDLAEHQQARRAKRCAQLMSGDDGVRGNHKALRGLVDANVPRPRSNSLDGMDQSPFCSAADAGMAGPSDENVGGGDKVKFCRACKTRPAEHLFTSEDVREIVARAVAKREGEVRTEYDQVLQTQMAEQFNNFRRFHEDYVSRQLNQSDYSYMS
jgi:hypothetical protein